MDNYLSKMKKPKLNSTSLTPLYNYWFKHLLSRCSRLFKWNTNNMINQKHIELPLILNGHCAVFDFEGLKCLGGCMGGKPKFYPDEYENYFVSSANGKSFQLEIDKNCVMIDNDNMRIGFKDMCHKYALELAHNDVTMIMCLVSYRNIIGVPIASTSKTKIEIDNYINNLFNGVIKSVQDMAFMGVEFKEVNVNKNVSISELTENRNKILEKFYNELGIKTNIEKKGNLITEELDSNNTMLAFNVNDLLDCRKDACEKINNMFGVNWSVELSPEIQAILEKGANDIEKNNITE